MRRLCADMALTFLGTKSEMMGAQTATRQSLVILAFSDPLTYLICFLEWVS